MHKSVFVIYMTYLYGTTQWMYIRYDRIIIYLYGTTQWIYIRCDRTITYLYGTTQWMCIRYDRTNLETTIHNGRDNTLGW